MILVERRGGFTLMELLVVVAIISILMGMLTYNFAKPEVRRTSVKLAAEELAATFRKARALAMERKTVHAVVFHIQNKPGSSGIVLNNRSGGHWYRILGPGTSDTNDRSQTADDLPPIANGGYGYKPHNVMETSELINRAWVDDPHILLAGKVRFLALTDMDYGDSSGVNWAYRGISTTDYFPRPWFGWYDTTSKRLYPWGGYDPAIAGSGFYYWGVNRVDGAITTATRDPQPIGSRNPVARTLDHWSVGQGNNWYDNMLAPSAPASDTLYEADSPRPVINAFWRDCSLIFLSTGEVRWGNWLPARKCSFLMDGITTVATGSLPMKRGISDRQNGQTEAYAGYVSQHTVAEAGNFDQDSGGWFITLAPDSVDDKDTFPSAEDALASISPMYRVFVSRLGEVKVIAVSKTPKLNGLTAFPPTEAWWRNATNMQQYFPADRLLDGTIIDTSWCNEGLGILQGKPITDFVTPTMLRERQVWMK